MSRSFSLLHYPRSLHACIQSQTSMPEVNLDLIHPDLEGQKPLYTKGLPFFQNHTPVQARFTRWTPSPWSQNQRWVEFMNQQINLEAVFKHSISQNPFPNCGSLTECCIPSPLQLNFPGSCSACLACWGRSFSDNATKWRWMSLDVASVVWQSIQ